MLLGHPHAASASDDDQNPPALTELTLEQLGDIQVVSVSKRPEEVWHTGAAVHVITHDDIKRSGATSIPEVLRLAPGIEVARIDSDHWSIGVRGFGDQFSKSLLVLIDGRSIYTPLFAGMYWPAHDALLDDVDRIEVIRGPGGTIWGADAVTGVINIITKSAADTRGAVVTAGAGNVDHGIGAFRYGGGDSTHAYRVYAKGASRGAEDHADDASFDDWWTTQTGFRADVTPNSEDTFTLQGDLSKGSHGQRVTVPSFSPPAQVPLDGNLDAFGVNLRARWDRTITAQRGFHLQAYFDRTSWLAPHFGEQRNTFDVDFVHDATVAARHTITAGAGARVSPSHFIQMIPSLNFTPGDETSSVYSAFAQDEIALVPDRLWLTAGSKVEHNSYTGFEVQPDVRAVWMPHADQSIWGAVTRAVRTPSRIENAIVSTAYSTTTVVPIYLRINGNADFQAERTLSYEAGYRARPVPRTYVDIAAFHNVHRGLGSFGLGNVSLEQTPSPLHAVADVVYVNGVNGTSDGFEVSPDWQLSPALQLRGSYSFVRFDLSNAPDSIDVNAVNRYEGASPHHQTRLEAHAAPIAGVDVDLTYRAVSALSAPKVPGYGTADARIGLAISKAMELAVVGQNLLTPSHPEFGHLGLPVGIARSIYVELRWQRANQP
jgi:iron complex outermembrane receptor protein